MADMMTSLAMMPDDQYATAVAGLGLDDATKQGIDAQRAAVRGMPPAMPMASEPAPDPSLGYRAGSAVREALPTLDAIGRAGVWLNPLTAPIAAAGALGKAALNQGTDLIRGATGRPSSAEEQAQAQPAAAQPAQQQPGMDPAALAVAGRQPQGAQLSHAGQSAPRTGGGGGGAFSAIAREAAQSRKQAVAGTAEAERLAGEAVGLEEDAAQQSLDAGRTQNAAELKLIKERNAGLNDLHAKTSENEAKRRDTMTGEMKKYDELSEAAKSVEEDPDRWYKSEDGSTNYGKKIGAALAVALGQFGAALSGGPNTAMQIIQGAIDKDIEAQRMTARGKEKDAERQRTRLDDLREQFGDDRRSELMLEDQYLSNFERKLDEVAAASKDATLLANHAQTKAASRARRAEIKNQFTQQTDAITQRGLATQADLAAKSATLGIQREELDLRRAAAGGKAQALPEAVRARLAQIRAARDGLKNVDANKPGQLEAFFSKMAPWDTDSDKFNRAGLTKLITANKAVTGEATNESDVKRLQGDAPRATSAAGANEQRVKTFRDQLDSAERELLGAHGIEWAPEDNTPGSFQPQ